MWKNEEEIFINEIHKLTKNVWINETLPKEKQKEVLIYLYKKGNQVSYAD